MLLQKTRHYWVAIQKTRNHRYRINNKGMFFSPLLWHSLHTSYNEQSPYMMIMISLCQNKMFWSGNASVHTLKKHRQRKTKPKKNQQTSHLLIAIDRLALFIDKHMKFWNKTKRKKNMSQWASDFRTDYILDANAIYLQRIYVCMYVYVVCCWFYRVAFADDAKPSSALFDNRNGNACTNTEHIM